MTIKDSAQTALIDTHVHLDEIESVETALENARAVGVSALVAVGLQVASNLNILKLAEKFSAMVYPAIGYHPWSIRADDVDETLQFVEEHLDACVALGEVGLDYKIKVKKTLQREVFARLLGIAKAKQKPVVVHSRLSHGRTHQMVRAAGIEKAVFHWYSGPLEILDGILADGYHVSATPALSYSPPHRAAMARAPLEKILIETDAPVVYQGKVSQPADVRTTLEELSRLRRMPENELARITTDNARRFFQI